MDTVKFKVREIELRIATPFFIEMHYAQRMPSVSFLYGLYSDETLVGVLSIGKPASASLCSGVCGDSEESKVYELNRLIVKEGLPKNTLSFFVSKVLKLLKSDDLIIVSYADTGAGHNGYIYQATNFIYTGVTQKRTDIYALGKHARHSKVSKENLRRVRTPKHRYIYFTKRSKLKSYLEILNYEIEPYPKGDNSSYVLGSRIATRVEDTDSGLTYREYNKGSAIVLGYKRSLIPNVLDDLVEFYLGSNSTLIRITFKDGTHLVHSDFLHLISVKNLRKVFDYKEDDIMPLYKGLVKYHVLLMTMRGIDDPRLVEALTELSTSHSDIIFASPSSILGVKQFNNVYLGCNLLGETVKAMSSYFVMHRDQFTSDTTELAVSIPGSNISKISLV